MPFVSLPYAFYAFVPDKDLYGPLFTAKHNMIISMRSYCVRDPGAMTAKARSPLVTYQRSNGFRVHRISSRWGQGACIDQPPFLCQVTGVDR